MTLAKCLAFSGLALDIVGVLIIGLRSERWMVQFWRSSSAQLERTYNAPARLTPPGADPAQHSTW